MHKFIATCFSSILTTFHITFFVGLVGIALFSESALFAETGLNQVQLIIAIVGTAVLYVLFAGVTSVLIRINQNLEAVSSYLEEMAIDYDELEED